MITPITSIARLARQTRAVSVPLLVAGALVAGCGTVAANPGGVNEPDAHSTGHAASTSTSAPTASASATPVPTVTGGPVTAGATACVGWPSDAPHGKLTALFQPVAVERCVTGIQAIAGKGEWETATMERSTDKLATLVAVLLQPSARVQPGIFCPEYVVIPPQLVLISSAGQKLIPQLPLGSCGSTGARVLTTLASMSWQPVSVRLISKVSSTAPPRTLPGASIGPSLPLPKALRTGAPAAPAVGAN
jgi:hypothetical protein